MISELDRFIEAAEAAESFGELRRVCLEYFDAIGAKMASYSHLPPFGASDRTPGLTIATEGFPKEWVDRYVNDRLYEIDPIPRHALASGRPIWWSEARKIPNLSDEEKTYLDIVSASGVGDGLSIPVYGPNGRNGYASVGFGPRRPDLSTLEIRRIRWACQIGHERYCELLSANAPANVSLSPREQEILNWVARGKSNSVIAEIIGISANTVDTYMRRIYAKLEVADRVTAALRALALGAV